MFLTAPYIAQQLPLPAATAAAAAAAGKERPPRKFAIVSPSQPRPRLQPQLRGRSSGSRPISD
eukprot:7536137-Pyramimonas_sp.AAC.1